MNRVSMGKRKRINCGDLLRGKTEHCLLAIKGKPVITLTTQTSVLFGPMRKHSQKPDEFYDLVESLCPAPEGGRVELFQRKPRPGWVGHGDEVRSAPCQAQGAPFDEDGHGGSAQPGLPYLRPEKTIARVANSEAKAQ